MVGVGTLEDPEAGLDALLDSVAAGVMAVDERGRFTIFNQAARWIFGIEVTDVDPDGWSERYGLYLADGKTHVPTTELPLYRAWRGEAFDNLKLVVRNDARPDGVDVSVNGRPWLDRHGKLRGAVIVFRDVTDLRKSEERLRRALAELRQQASFMDMVFEGISDGVVVADADGRLTRANRSAERMVGLGIKDVSTGEWSETYGTYFADEETAVPEAELPLAQAVAGKSTDNVDLFIRNEKVPQGVHICVSGRPLRDPAGKPTGGVIVFHDSTQRVRMQNELQRAFAGGRLEIIETVLHNIGNAINSAATGTDTLLAEFRNDELLCRFTALADAVEAHEDDWIAWLTGDPQGRRLRPFLLALVGDLTLENARRRQVAERVSGRLRHVVDIIRTQKSFAGSTVEHKSVDLRTAIESAADLVRESLSRRDIELTVDCSRGPRRIRVQESRFNQMLVNLLKNAVEAIDARAHANGGLDEKPFIRVVANTERDHLVLDVSDNGIGIAPELMHRIFWAGYTTKAAGSGFGLHSAASFVSSAGGRITPFSEGVGRGATMRVLLRLPGEAVRAPASRR